MDSHLTLNSVLLPSSAFPYPATLEMVMFERMEQRRFERKTLFVMVAAKVSEKGAGFVWEIRFRSIEVDSNACWGDELESRRFRMVRMLG